MNNGKSVTKREEGGALSTNLFEADADKGSQNISQEDLALPFLKVLGQLSPEVNKQHGKHVEGAEPGMILNTVSNECYDGSKGCCDEILWQGYNYNSYRRIDFPCPSYFQPEPFARIISNSHLFEYDIINLYPFLLDAKKSWHSNTTYGVNYSHYLGFYSACSYTRRQEH